MEEAMELDRSRKYLKWSVHSHVTAAELKKTAQVLPTLSILNSTY